MRSKESQEHVSSALQLTPVLTKAEEKCPCSRPRLIWTNISLESSNTASILWNSCIDEGWVPAFLSDDPTGSFGTFLRPFPPGRPPEFPASYARLPLSAYDRYGLVMRSDLSASDLSDVQLRLSKVHDSTGDSKDPSSSSFLSRKELCEFIHLRDGFSKIRPLSASERLRCLGFRSIQAPDHGMDLSAALPWLSVTGNTFAVPVFMDLLALLVSDIQHSRTPSITRLELNLMDRRSALLALGSTVQVNKRR
jgi:hypothetical protein